MVSICPCKSRRPTRLTALVRAVTSHISQAVADSIVLKPDNLANPPHLFRDCCISKGPVDHGVAVGAVDGLSKDGDVCQARARRHEQFRLTVMDPSTLEEKWVTIERY